MNSSLQQLQERFARLGPDSVDIEAIAQTGDDTWTLAFDDEQIVMVEWIDGPPRIVFTCLVGRPPVDRRFTVYETLLTYNALWKEHDGARIALDGADGEVMVLYELPAAALTEAQLADVIARFRDFAALWCAYVLAEQPTADLPPVGIAMFSLMA